MPFILCEYAHAMGNGPGRAGRLPGAVRAPPALPGRLRLGVDRPRASATPTRGFYAYGGDFGEPLHDGNFVADGLAVPRPHALAGAARAQEGLRAGARSPAALGGGCGSRTASRLPRPLAPDVRRGCWRRRACRSPRASCASARCRPARSPSSPLPDELPAAAAGDVADRARRARGRRAVGAGGPRGRLGPDRRSRPRRLEPRARWRSRRSDAAFIGSAGTSIRAPACSTRLGALALIGPRLDVWRAPTDNDEGYHGPEQLAPLWRAHGLDRMRHRTLAVELDGDALVVRTRVAPAATDLGAARDLHLDRRGRRAGAGARGRPGPRVGLPAAAAGRALRRPGGARRRRVVRPRAGRGLPGLAARRPRRPLLAPSVEDLQTPYLMPQENGSRTEVRWARARRRLRIEGRPHFELTVRPWTSRGAGRRPPPARSRRPTPTGCGSTPTSPSRASAPPPAARACSRSTASTPAPSRFGLVFRT